MALTRITKGVIKPNENYDTHNINSTGIVTAIGLDVNGNGDISGNLSVGGVLTYEDVTSIDSVGIITAQKDIHVGAGVSAVGVGTFGGLDVNGNGDISGNLDINRDLDVDGHTNLDNVSVAGVSTFTGAIDANGDLDVDGHTNLDNVSIAGVTTFTGDISIAEKIVHTGDTNTTIRFPSADTFTVETGGSERLRCDSDGVKVQNGRFYSAGTFGYIESSSTSTATLTLKKSASGADSIDYLQLRDNSNAVKFKISGDGILFTSDVLASHEGDTNTKIRFPADDNIAFETAGIQRLRITSTGDVNIGGELTQTDSRVHIQDVTRPLQEGTLTLSSASTTDGAANNGATLRFFGHDGVGTRYQSSIRGAKENGTSGNYAGYLAFNTRPNGGSMVERLRITSDGRIIIGATSGGNADTDDLIVSGSGKRGITVCSTNGSETRLTFADGLSGVNAVAGNITYTHSNDSMDLYTSTSRRLRVDSSGRMLLGTILPNHYPDRMFTINRDAGAGIELRNNSTSTGQISFSDTNGSGIGAYRGYIQYQHNNGSMHFATQSTERLRITSNGNIEIGSAAGTGSDFSLLDGVIINAANGDAGLMVNSSSSSHNAYISFSYGSGSSTSHADQFSAYIGRVGDNTLILGTNNNVRATLTSGGDFIIGNTTTTDGAHFQHYQSSARHQSFQSTNGDLAIVTDNNSNPAVYIKGTGTADLVNVFDNTTEVFTIKDGGNVGINETSPDKLLHITHNNSPYIRTTLNDTTVSANNVFGAWEFESLDSSLNCAGVVGKIDCIANATFDGTSTNGADIRFLTSTTNPISLTEKLRITSAGLIQAKTRTASERRMILAGSPSNSAFNIEAHDGATGTSSGTVQGELGLYYNDGSTLSDTATIKFERGSGAPDGAMTIFTNNAERLRIQSDGNVNIGSSVNAGNTLRYLDVSNFNTGGSAGSIVRLLTTKSDGTGAVGLDMVKYKGGGASFLNYENIGDNGFISFHTGSSGNNITQRLRIRGDGTTIFGSTDAAYQSNTVSIHPSDGMVNFGMDGRDALITGVNSCYIYSGSGAGGAMPAGSLILQSRANVNRNIFFATGATPSLKWQINGSNGSLQEYPYNTATSSQLTSTSNGYELRRVRNGQVPTMTSGSTYTLFNTNEIGDAGAYIIVLRSFEQNVTGSALWSVRIVSSVFYLHSGSGNDGETVNIPVTHAGHANNASNPPVTLKIHLSQGSHTHGRISITPNGFSYTGSNCDYYVYKLIDI